MRWITEVEERREKEKEVMGQERAERIGAIHVDSRGTGLGIAHMEKVQCSMEPKRAKEKARTIPG